MMEWFDYEAVVFALGGETICPTCDIGILIPLDITEPETAQCDICGDEFELQEEEPQER